MEWACPWAFALWVPVLALVVRHRWVGRAAVRVPQLGGMQGGVTLRVAVAWLPEALRLLGLSLVVVALARPQHVERNVFVESDGLDILLAVDTSGSMKARDFAIGGQRRTRLEVAKGVLRSFVERRPYDRIGLVVFGQEAFTFVPLTLDHDTLDESLDLVQIGIAGSNSTALGAAIAVSARRMKQVDAKERIVILLTDGRNNVERPEPRQAAQAAGALGIRIYTVGIGASGSLLGGDAIDEPALREIARLTGAQFFRATHTRELQGVYDTIDRLETSPARVRQLVDAVELYRWFLIPGCSMLVLSLLLSATWLRRGP